MVEINDNIDNTIFTEEEEEWRQATFKFVEYINGDGAKKYVQEIDLVAKSIASYALNVIVGDDGSVDIAAAVYGAIKLIEEIEGVDSRVVTYAVTQLSSRTDTVIELVQKGMELSKVLLIIAMCPTESHPFRQLFAEDGLNFFTEAVLDPLRKSATSSGWHVAPFDWRVCCPTSFVDKLSFESRDLSVTQWLDGAKEEEIDSNGKKQKKTVAPGDKIVSLPFVLVKALLEKMKVNLKVVAVSRYSTPSAGLW